MNTLNNYMGGPLAHYKECMLSEGAVHLLTKSEPRNAWLINILVAQHIDCAIKWQNEAIIGRDNHHEQSVSIWQAWELRWDEESGVINYVVDDGNHNVIAFGTFKNVILGIEKLTIWRIDNTILLPGEY